MIAGEAPIVLRPIEAEDFEAWLPLWQAYQLFYAVEIPAATTRTTWERFLDSREPMQAAMAFRGSAAVGLVHWIVHRSTSTQGDYCYLQDLFVAPASRGAAVGRRLIAYVYAAAEAAGAARVYWLTHETNRQAMVLYDTVAEKSGFVQYRKQLTPPAPPARAVPSTLR